MIKSKVLRKHALSLKWVNSSYSVVRSSSQPGCAFLLLHNAHFVRSPILTHFCEIWDMLLLLLFQPLTEMLDNRIFSCQKSIWLDNDKMWKKFIVKEARSLGAGANIRSTFCSRSLPGLDCWDSSQFNGPLADIFRHMPPGLTAACFLVLKTWRQEMF